MKLLIPGAIVGCLLIVLVAMTSLGSLPKDQAPVPKKTFEQHVEDANKKFDRVQKSIEDKLDKIQEILENHVEE
jgi:hypothetical protein